VEPVRAQLMWSPQAPRVARAVVRAWLDAVECDHRVRTDLVIAASELVTRAVNGCPAEPTLMCSWTPDGALVAIGSAPMLAQPDGGRDLGATVLTAVCDDWGCEGDEMGTNLWAHVRW